MTTTVTQARSAGKLERNGDGAGASLCLTGMWARVRWRPIPDPRLRLRSRVVVTTATGGCASPRRDDQFGPALWLFRPRIRVSSVIATRDSPKPALYRYLWGPISLMGGYLALIHVMSADLRQRLFVSDACLVLSCANLSWMILCSIVC